MTEYTEIVEKQEQKLEAEAWGKRVNYILASNGIIETAFNNGDIQYVENKPNGKTTWHRTNKTKESILNTFLRWSNDQRYYKK